VLTEELMDLFVTLRNTFDRKMASFAESSDGNDQRSKRIEWIDWTKSHVGQVLPEKPHVDEIAEGEFIG
jgi:hypothetical protein